MARRRRRSRDGSTASPRPCAWPAHGPQRRSGAGRRRRHRRPATASAVRCSPPSCARCGWTCTVTGYPTRAALRQYVHGSAEVIGLQLLPVLGTVCARPRRPPTTRPRSAARSSSPTSCATSPRTSTVAASTCPPTNSPRTASTATCSPGAAAPAAPSRAYGRALADQVARTRAVYRRAQPGLALLHPAARPCVATAFTLYSAHPRPDRGARAQRLRRPRLRGHRPAAGRRRRRRRPCAVEPPLLISTLPVTREGPGHGPSAVPAAARRLPGGHAAAGAVRQPRLPAARPAGPRRAARRRAVSWPGTSWPSRPACGATTRATSPGVALPLSLPLEEALFFLVVPVCAVLTFETVRRLAAEGRDRARLHGAGRRRGGRAVVAAGAERLRTGLFRRRAYWITMAIVFAFQVAVDGWLTKAVAPIVIYDPHRPQRGARSVRHSRRGLPVRVRPRHRDAARLAAGTRAPGRHR